MRVALAWLGVAALFAAGAVAQAPVVVECDPAPAQAYVGQRVPYVVRVGVDTRWLTEQAVPLLARALDRPFHVACDGLRDDETRRVVVEADGGGVRIATGDQVLAWRRVGERAIEGRTFEWLELRAQVVGLRPGALMLPPVVVRYAFGTRFQDDFLRGRQALDRQVATVAGPALGSAVLPLPAGAPPGFTGAVGAFTVQAVPAVPAAAVGDSVTVALHVRGPCDAVGIQPPTALALPGFHLQGATVAPAPGGCTIALDLLALRAGDTLGPIPFVAFDPERAAYTTVATAPVPLAIAPAAAPERLPARVRERIAADAATLPGTGLPTWAWAMPLALLAALLAVRPWWVGSARARRVQRCVAALEQALANDATAAAAAFTAWVVARSDGRASDAAGLAACGVAAEVVAALRDHESRLQAARFGGPLPDAAGLLATLRRAR